MRLRDFVDEVPSNSDVLLADLLDKVAVDDRRDRRVVERIVRSALELSDRQLVLLDVAVDRRRVLACLLQVARHVEQGVGSVPVPDEAGGMEVTEDFHLHNEPHVHDHVGVRLVRLVELGERSEERLVRVVGHGDVPDLGQDVLLDPSVGHFRVRQATDEASDLGTALVVDECADCERLAPQPVGFCVESEYFL